MNKKELLKRLLVGKHNPNLANRLELNDLRLEVSRLSSLIAQIFDLLEEPMLLPGPKGEPGDPGETPDIQERSGRAHV